MSDALLDIVQRSAGIDADGHPLPPSPAEILPPRRFNYAVTPPPLRAVYSLAGQPISTPGNLTTITAAVKSGKSAVIGAMTASVITPDPEQRDLLGFASENPHRRALFWFDSEQSPDDFWHGVARSLRRAGVDECPPWLYAYCLTGLSCGLAWDCVMTAVEDGSRECGGTHSILLDGAADFVADVNDPAESNRYVTTLHNLAIKHDCPIAGVIHFNPGSDKSRGHLGSQLERKAETNLALEKDGNETTVIYSTKNRRAGIPKNIGPRFRYDREAGMHISVESRGAERDTEERERLLDLAEDLFGDRPAMGYADLASTVKKRLTVSDRTAERKVDRMKRLTVIRKSIGGLYVITRDPGN